jgi:hypothetical protein
MAVGGWLGLEPDLPRQRCRVRLIITQTTRRMMGFVQDTAKKIAFWTYPRTSWQWDVLCVLILVFIFLTPRSWFENNANQRTHMVQATVVVSTDVIGSQLDRAEIERRVRVQAGRSGAEVSAVRERRDNSGKLIAYEVDIR